MLMFLNFWLRILALPLIVGVVVGFVCYAGAHVLGARGYEWLWALGGVGVAVALTLVGVIALINSADIG